MSTRNLPGRKGRPALKADNFTAIRQPILSQTYGRPRPVTVIALRFAFISISYKSNLMSFLRATDSTPIYLALMMLRILGNELEGKDLYAVTRQDTRQTSHLSPLNFI
jgi:hypothetical protein